MEKLPPKTTYIFRNGAYFFQKYVLFCCLGNASHYAASNISCWQCVHQVWSDLPRMAVICTLGFQRDPRASPTATKQDAEWTHWDRHGKLSFKSRSTQGAIMKYIIFTMKWMKKALFWLRSSWPLLHAGINDDLEYESTGKTVSWMENFGQKNKVRCLEGGRFLHHGAGEESLNGCREPDSLARAPRPKAADKTPYQGLRENRCGHKRVKKT